MFSSISDTNKTFLRLDRCLIKLKINWKIHLILVAKGSIRNQILRFSIDLNTDKRIRFPFLLKNQCFTQKLPKWWKWEIWMMRWTKLCKYLKFDLTMNDSYAWKENYWKSLTDQMKQKAAINKLWKSLHKLSTFKLQWKIKKEISIQPLSCTIELYRLIRNVQKIWA